MRPIKFRAWNKDKKTMSVPDHLGFTEGELICIDFDAIVPYGSFELMQYTGLKDKTGKGIYEGDIVKYKFDYINYGNSKTDIIIQEIKFKNGAFYPRPHLDICEDKYYTTNAYDFEIIGNIHENIELLEQPA
jgi:uncharacterized phage protein (TIGR01671 family)